MCSVSSIALIPTGYDNGVALMPPHDHPHLVFRLTPADVGERVTVRYALPGGGYSDALGQLESWAEGTLSVRRRDGSLVQISEESAVAGKTVPPPPPRRRPRA